jgi:GntR family transcriptional regulator/MocR family aminotransferase
MADWIPPLFLDPTSEAPAFRQIAQGLIAEIRRGRFRAGDPLPGYRALAAQLGVSRNTVMAAYQELQAGGWVLSRGGAGSVVAPQHSTESDVLAPPDTSGIGFDLSATDPPATATPKAGVVDLATGVPDPRLVPGDLVARAYRRAITSRRANPLEINDPHGHPRLREALAAMVRSTRGITASPADIFVTMGAQNAIYLVARALLEPGDAVGVEALGSRGAWKAFVSAGARCLPIPVDADGLDVDALAKIAATVRLRAVLVTPQRQYPTLAVLSQVRRNALLALAARNRIALLEVDQDTELQYEGRPLAPLAAVDRAGVVVHIGSLDKILSPGLRLGFVHAPRPLIERLAVVHHDVDAQGDLVLQRALAELMEDGEVQGHMARMLPVHRRRRDALAEALRRELCASVTVRPVTGGLALWADVEGSVDVDAWSAAALRRGVFFRSGRHFNFEGAAVAGLRIGFASAREEDLEEVARRMKAALEEQR